jgi:hypothetical protein
LLPSMYSHAQVVLDVHLTDFQKRPLSFAIVKNEGKTVTSDEAGFFRIAGYRANARISIHKLGFADTTISFAPLAVAHDTLTVTVNLRLKPMQLPEVSVTSAAAAEINPVRANFITGYELLGEDLVELLSNDYLVVLDADNKIKSHTRPVSATSDIVKDPKGDLFLLTEEAAFKLSVSATGKGFDAVAADRAALKWNLTYCAEVTDTSRFIRRYKDINQTVAFFAVSDAHRNHVKMLKEISDAERKSAVQAFANETNGLLAYLASANEANLGGVMGEIDDNMLTLYRKSEWMVAKLEKNYSLPSYSFLKLVNDSIYLFAHDIDSMLVYDKYWTLARGQRIGYHHLKSWGKELIANEERTRVFAKLVENSVPMLAEIDLQTGALKGPFIPIEARFPARMRVRKDVLYYMAKQKSGTGCTVYSQKIPPYQ